MSFLRSLPVVVPLLLAAACSSVPHAQRVARQQAAYASAAGGPVRSFRFFSLYSWEALGDRQVAIYTRPTEAWLLDLGAGCPDIEFGNSLGLTSSFGQVSVGLDRVVSGRTGFPCTISAIRPVDVKKLKAERQRQREIHETPRDTPPGQ